MAHPNDVKKNGTCKFCGDKLSKEYTRNNHPNKLIRRHLTNKNCQQSKGKAEMI